MTITESKRTGDYDGTPEYEKHKIFLYKEDFEKFSDGMGEALDKIKSLWETGEYKMPEERPEYEENKEEVSFEEL